MPAVTSSAPLIGESNHVQKMGFLVTAAFVFCYISRILDLTVYYLHLPLILSYLALFALLISGNVLIPLKTKTGVMYAAMTALFLAGIPFAVFRGGSANTIRVQWSRAILIWMFVVGLTVTYKECKSLLNACAYGTMVAAALALVAGKENVEGRLAMESGKSANPNEFALILMVGLPLIWRLFHDGGRPGAFRKLFAAGGFLLVFAVFIRAGSRAGMYSVGVAVLLIFLRAPMMRKLQLVVCCVAAVVILAAVLPNNLRHRYLTFETYDSAGLESKTDVTAVGSAAASTQSRMMLLQEGLNTAFRFPIFGVGLNNFPVYINQLNRELGRKKEAWLGVHNTYLQYACETGFPAAFLFIAILIFSWRSLGKLVRATRNDPRPEARDIYFTAVIQQIALGAFCCFIFFDFMAYDITPHLMVALCLVTARTATSELESLKSQDAGKLLPVSHIRPARPARRPAVAPVG